MKGIDWAGLAEKGRAQAVGLMAHLPGRTPPEPLPHPEAAPWMAPKPAEGKGAGPFERLRGMAAALRRGGDGADAPAAGLLARAIAPLRARLSRPGAEAAPAVAAPDRSRRLMRTVAVGVATLSVAFVAGNFVQSDLGAPRQMNPEANPRTAGNAAAAPTGIVQLAAPAEATVAGAPAPAALPEPSAAALARADGPGLPAAPAVPAAPETLKQSETTVAAAAPACPVTLDLAAGAGGLLDVTFAAPCAAGETVVLRHAGLAFSAALDAAGGLSLTLPAFDAAGVVTLRLADGTDAEEAAPVDLSGLRRYAVQWQAPDAFALNAYEGGAAHGEPGHISASGPRAVTLAPQPSGWMVRLGEGLPLVAEVYTFPDAPGAAPRLSIEAEVTEATCGREMLGETLLSVRGLVTVEELTLAMPGCEDAIGDFLVLNNPLSETTLAAAVN